MKQDLIKKLLDILNGYVSLRIISYIYYDGTYEYLKVLGIKKI